MESPNARVYNIAPGGDFLQVLANEILLGYPFGQSQRETLALANWTILLPTRRSARLLGTILAQKSGRRAILLPTIKPIGDIDDGRLQDDGRASDIPASISRTGQLAVLLGILSKWAFDNPQTNIAQEIQQSQHRSLGLANSLLQLVDQMETGETNLDQLSEAYNVELSDHRTGLLSLLALLKIDFPQKLLEENLMGPAARRSLLIRLEANRIAHSTLRGPIIAAGSTGTIPATRALLNAIAHHSQGAVVLPGLDLEMSEDDWHSIGPDHPQSSLQNLIVDMKIERQNIIALSTGNPHRNFMSAELMRPSATTENWQPLLNIHVNKLKKATEQLQIIKAPDRHIEARAISLILREALETPNQTAALVTPDRDLAQRVKVELLRWGIVIDDSAGEPLHHHGIAALASQLLHAVANGLTAADLLALLSHPDVTLELNPEKFKRCLYFLEIVVLRGYGGENGLTPLQEKLTRVQEAKRQNQRLHPLVSSMTGDDWLELEKFVNTLTNLLSPLFEDSEKTAAHRLAILETAIQKLSPTIDWSTKANQSFAETMDEVRNEVRRLPDGSFADLSPLIIHVLHEKTLQLFNSTHPRLAIYGVLEARLIPADVIVLGGLNEGIWPAQTDSGPWLNRPMRSLFGMQSPERDIGVSAHDFTQALGYSKIYLTCSKRLENTPKIPSRWLLRLETIIEGAGLNPDGVYANDWLQLALALDASEEQAPHQKPKPQPPLAVRPTQFSVTEVERLIRDPYSTYVRKILKIEPLPNLAAVPDAALRGTLFHEALKIWNQQLALSPSIDKYSILLSASEEVFAPYQSNSEIFTFWHSRFKRIAAWINSLEPNFRDSASSIHAEISGRMEFEISSTTYKLTAKADRIDILANGKARIIDYKSGIPPSAKTVRSGISPQLPLEAAIMLANGFHNLSCKSVDEMLYLHITGSMPAGEVKEITASDNQSLDALAQVQLDGFKKLLASYQNPRQAYFPRAAVQKEDDITDFDQLSRYKEWMLAGQ